VFLIQGSGRRRWRIGAARASSRAAGDLLYLPPGVRHDGVALEPCFTTRSGFRRAARRGAPARRFPRLAARARLPDARYRDPGCGRRGAQRRYRTRWSRSPRACFGRIRWTRAEVASFLGQHLSMPKPHVVFEPRRPRRGGTVRLDPKSPAPLPRLALFHQWRRAHRPGTRRGCAGACSPTSALQQAPRLPGRGSGD